MKEKLERAVEDKNISIEAAKKKFDQIHNHVKYKAFGKVTLGQKKKEKNYKEIECFDKEEREEIKAKKQYEEQVVRAEKEMKEIDKIVNGKVGKVWEIKKKIIGGKKAVMEATAVVNPESGRLAVSKEEVLKITLKYCKDTLNNNLPEDKYKHEIEKKRE